MSNVYDPLQPLMAHMNAVIANRQAGTARRRIVVKHEPELNEFPLVFVDLIGSFQVKPF